MHHAHDKFLKIRIVQVYCLYDVCEETEAISSDFFGEKVYIRFRTVNDGDAEASGSRGTR